MSSARSPVSTSNLHLDATTDSLWRRLLRSRPFLLEGFVLSNVAFLIADVVVAHAVNDFAHWAEWIPVGFAAVGTVVLTGAIVAEVQGRSRWAWWLGTVVAWASIAVGLSGLVWHLEAWFFEAVTLRSLVYSAPFVAPLAFAGLGCLLLVNRYEDGTSPTWGRWVVFLAWGGFVGNFVLSVVDHAQNGFFFWEEWISVVASALAVGMLAVVVTRRPTERVLQAAYGVCALQVVVGVLGFGLHVTPLVTSGALASGDASAVVFGAPVFAPLLFVDLAVLAVLGLWHLHATHDVPAGNPAT